MADDSIELAAADGNKIRVQRCGVYVANVNPGQVSDQFTRSLVDLCEFDRVHNLGLWRGTLYGNSGANIAKVRNELVQRFLEQPDGDWLLMVDSDMVFPPETMLRLLAAAEITGAKIVGGLCVFVGADGPFPTLYQWRPDAITGVQWDFPDDAQVQVAATGTACLMVHRTVFETCRDHQIEQTRWLLDRIDDPAVSDLVARGLVHDPSAEWGWFQERVRIKRQPDGVSEHWCSEDIDFCLRMGDLGFPIFVDTSTQIGHVKHGRVWYASDIRDGTGVPRAKIVAVVPVKDRFDLTTDLIRQLRQQGDCDEIVVCDNGSATRTRNWLASQNDLTVFDMADAGIHEMWNRGIDHALERHGPRTRVAFLNNDLKLGPAFLRTLSEAFDHHRELNAVCGNYDSRTADTDIVLTTDICAGRYDGTGGFAGFAFMVRGEWFSTGYRFPEDMKWWCGDNDLVATITRADVHRGMDDRPSKAAIVTGAHVEHLDGGSQTSKAAGSEFTRQCQADIATFRRKWDNIAALDKIRDVNRQFPDLAAHQPVEGAKVAVVSAVFGGYDDPEPFPQQTIECDAVLVTDRPYDVPGWRNIVVTGLDPDPRMASKQVKCQPERWVPQAEHIIWVDGQITVRSPAFTEWCLDRADGALVAATPHHQRNSIVAEAEAGQGPQGRGRFTGQDTIGQAKHYLDEGHPDSWGLWWTAVMVRDHTLANMDRFGAAWLAEQQKWSTHDQVSFPHVARVHLGRPADLPFLGFDNLLYRLRPRKTGP